MFQLSLKIQMDLSMTFFSISRSDVCYDLFLCLLGLKPRSYFLSVTNYSRTQSKIIDVCAVIHFRRKNYTVFRRKKETLGKIWRHIFSHYIFASCQPTQHVHGILLKLHNVFEAIIKSTTDKHALQQRG